jgi:cytochrome P450 family 114
MDIPADLPVDECARNAGMRPEPRKGPGRTGKSEGGLLMPPQRAVLDGGNVLDQLADPANRDDPYPILHRLRETDPVHRTSAGFHLLTRYADTAWVLQHSGTALRGSDEQTVRTWYAGADRHRSRALFLGTLMMKDPPDHSRLRRPLNRAFRAWSAGRVRRRTAEITARLLDAVAEPLRDGAPVDLHTALSLPLNTELISDFLGVPAEDSERLSALAAGVYPATMPLPYASPDSLDELFAAADRSSAELEEYLAGLFEQRRREPRDDVISALLHAGDGEAAPLGQEELVAMVWVLWTAGVATAAGGIDQCVRAMLLHPGHRHWLSGDPDAAGAFAAEALRLYGSSMFSGIIRLAVRDLDFQGVTVPAGSDVRPSIAAANRDPAVFPDPDRFDPARKECLALTYGAGIHYCVGAAMARLELATVLPALHARFPTLVAAGPPVWQTGITTRLLRALPVTVEQP